MNKHVLNGITSAMMSLGLWGGTAQAYAVSSAPTSYLRSTGFTFSGSSSDKDLLKNKSNQSPQSENVPLLVSDLEMTKSEASDLVISQSDKPHLDPKSQNINPSDLTLKTLQFTKGLILVDGAVPDKHVFYQSIKPGYEVVLIDETKNGLSQLKTILSQYRDLDSLHVVSHATDGVLQIGTSHIDEALLKREINTLAALDHALKNDADVMFYGCDLAKSEKGESLIQLISQEAKVDVAASNDLTGSQNKNGDWELELQQGNIQEEIPFSKIAMQQFNHVLAAKTYTGDNFCDNGISANQCHYAKTSHTSLDGDFILTGQDGVQNKVYAYSGSRPNGGIYLSYFAKSSGSIKVAADNVDVYSFQLTNIVHSTYGGASCSSGNLVGYVAGGGTVTIGLTMSGANNSPDLNALSGIQLTHFKVEGSGCTHPGTSNGAYYGIDIKSFTVDNKMDPPIPEINVKGNNQSIADGDSTPSVIDHTDFGSHTIGGSNLTRTFTVENTGTGDLDLTGSPLVAISGSSDFSITAQPVTNPVSAASSTTFQVTLDPTTVGTQNANISIANNDSDENPYNFSLTANINPLDSDGSLTAAAGVTEPINIDTTIDTQAEAINVFDFSLSDAGTGDGLAMNISQLVVNVSGTSTDAERNELIWRLNGPGVTNAVGSYSAVNDEITFGGLNLSVADGTTQTYTVNAYFNGSSSVVEDRTYILSIDGDTDVTVTAGGTQMGTTTPVTNGSGGAWDVVATSLGIVTQPSGLVSGEVMTTQPVVAARDIYGNTDTDFAETVNATLGSGGGTPPGTLSNTTVAAVNGIATFTSLTHTATLDGQGLQITFDDAVGGLNPNAANSNFIFSDVVATQLEFSTQPSGSVSGANLTTQPVVRAVGPNSVVDTDFNETITLTEASAGTLSGGSVAANAGIATFTAVNYVATADNQVFTLTADDQAGVGTDLPTVNANPVTSDVVATGLAFSTQPAGAVSGLALTTQPVVQAVDANGVVDTAFTETVTLTENGSGSIANASVAAVAGKATFTALTYSATADQELFVLTANDEDGVGADFGTVDANQLTADVVATQLVFDTQPVPLTVDSGEAKAFSTVPVVSARNANGLVDTGYNTGITLNEVNGAGSATMTGTGDADASSETVTITPSSGVSTFTGLSITYTASGSSSENFNLRATSGVLTTADSNQLTASSLNSDGSISDASGVDEPLPLYFSVNTSNKSWDIFDFTLSDGGTDDGQPFIITEIAIDVSGTSTDAERNSVVWRLAGADANFETGTYDAVNDKIVFSDLNISVADGMSEIYVINAYFDDVSSVKHGRTVQLAINDASNLTVDASGTQLTFGSAITNGLGSVMTDDVAPTITSVDVPADNTYVFGSDLVFTVNFDESISVDTSGGTPQLGLNIGGVQRSAEYFDGSGTNALKFRYTVQDGELDTDGISVLSLSKNNGSLADSAYNDANLTLNSVGSTAGVNIDAVVPTISESTAVVAAGNDATPDVVITASEPGIFSLSGSCGALVSTTTGLSGSNTITLTKQDGTTPLADGNYTDCRIKLNDAAGNESDTLTLTAFEIDTQDSNVASVTVPANDTYNKDAMLSFSVNFNDNVMFTESGAKPYLALTIGSEGKVATYQTGNGGQTLVFQYTVAANDEDLDGLSVVALNKNGSDLTDNAGNGVSLVLNGLPNTSAVLVDAKAPSVSEVTAVASIGNAVKPEVTISTTEAGTLTVGGSCGSENEGAISQGNSTINLSQTDNVTGLAEGIYAGCTVTVTDAAGNASLPVTLSTFEIDVTEPTVSETVVVATPTNDNTPIVTIQSSESGLLAVGGSCGTSSNTSISSSATPITLTQTDNTSALADGTYANCSVVVTDAAGNASSAVMLSEFKVDTVAPTLSEITAVATPTNDASPNVTLYSNEAGILALTGSCGTLSNTNVSTAGNVILALAKTDNVSDLDQGTYSDCAVKITDEAGNESTALTLTSFEIDTQLPTVTEAVAAVTPGNDSTPNVTINTTEAGALVIGGSCGSATSAVTVGDNVIALTKSDGTTALDDGTYNNCTVAVTDAGGNTSATTTLSEFIVDTTAPALATNAARTIDEGDTAVAINATHLSATDTVSSASNIRYLINAVPVNGTLKKNGVALAKDDSFTQKDLSDGVITYDHNGEENTADAFKFALVDGLSNQDDNAGNYFTYSLTVTPTNDAPNTVADTSTTDEDNAVVINVLANDTDVDDSINATTVSIASDATNGETSVDATSGAVTYTPNANFNGQDTFTYTVNDAAGATSAVATVTVTVNAVNDDPVAVADSASTTQNTAVTIDVAANDTDVDSGDAVDTSTIAITTNASNGNAVVENGKLVYTPTNNFAGSDTVSYTIQDSSGATSAVAVVTITVNDVTVPTVTITTEVASIGNNPKPTLTFVSTEAGTFSLNGSCASADTSVIAGSNTITVSTPTTFADLAEGLYAGCTLTVTDAAGNPSLPVTLSTFEIDVTEPTVSETVVVASPTNDNTPSVVITSTEAGALTIGGSCGGNEGALSSGQSTLTLTQTDNASALADGTYSNCSVVVTDAAGNASSVVTLSEFKVDTVAPTLSEITAVATPTNDASPNVTLSTNEIGTLALTGSCGTSSEKNISTAGTISLELTKTDGSSDLDQGTYSDCAVKITDEAGNESTELTLTSFEIDTQLPTVTEAVAVATPGNDSTPNVTINTTEAGTLVIGGSCGSATTTVTVGDNVITLTKSDGVTALDDGTYNNCTVAVTDAGGNTSATTALSEFIVDTTAPVLATNAARTIDEGDTAVAINATHLTATDAVSDSSAITYVVNTIPANGTLKKNGAALAKNDSFTQKDLSDGVITYDHNGEENTADAFKFALIDGLSNQDDNAGNYFTYSLTVTPTNDAPITVADTSTTDEDNAVVINVLANDTDVDDSINSTTVSIASDATNGETSVDATSGAVTYTPNENFNGQDTFTYTVNDASGATSAVATVTVTVNAVNDDPVAVNDTATTYVETAVTIDVAANDTDVDTGDAVDSSTISLTTTPENGTAAVENGKLVYTPNAGSTSQDTVSYTIEDQNGATSQVAVVTITIIPKSSELAISGSPTLETEEARAYSFTPTVSGNDSAFPLTFSIANKPAWASFNTTTGALTGTAATSSTNGITISVTDGTNSVALAAFDLSVVAKVDSDGDTISDFQEKLDGTDPNDASSYADTTPPTIDTPADITVDASGLYTAISIIDLLKLDDEADEEEIQAAIKQRVTDNVDGDGCCDFGLNDESNGDYRLEAGAHRITWKAEDKKGNISTATQMVNVRPKVSFGQDGVTPEGTTFNAEVHLSGKAHSYPYVIPFLISDRSTADASDHSLVAGNVTFNEGETKASIEIATATDLVSDDGEMLYINLDENADFNQGAKTLFGLRIVEGNLPPSVTMVVSQGDITTSKVSKAGGNVTVKANVTDLNPQDTHSFQWNSEIDEIVDVDADSTNDAFVFDPSELPSGAYQLTLTTTDSANASMVSMAHFVVVDSLPTLRDDKDTDGDGVSDSEEGHKDSDGDGIPDYMDNIAQLNVMPEEAKVTDAFLMNTEAGLAFKQGQYALQGSSGGSLLTEDDLDVVQGLIADSQSLTAAFNFEVSGLSESGSTATFVIPLRDAAPEDAVFRLFNGDSWKDFTEGANDAVYSTAGSKGFCPDISDDTWEEGIEEGHFCVMLKVQDGGTNDMDNLANQNVVITGGVSVEGEGSGSRSRSRGKSWRDRLGAVHPLVLMSLGLLFVVRRRTQ